MAEKPFLRMAALVDALGEALAPHLSVPFALFGHSMGALVSFELTRQLRRQTSFTPVHLFVASSAAPQWPNLSISTHHLSNQSFLQRLVRSGAIPELMTRDKELMELVLPSLRADYEVCETYRYSHEPPLDVPITAFGGLHDTQVSMRQLTAWQEQTRGAFRVRMFRGDHFFLNTSRAELLQEINTELARHLTPSS